MIFDTDFKKFSLFMQKNSVSVVGSVWTLNVRDQVDYDNPNSANYCPKYLYRSSFGIVILVCQVDIDVFLKVIKPSTISGMDFCGHCRHFWCLGQVLHLFLEHYLLQALQRSRSQPSLRSLYYFIAKEIKQANSGIFHTNIQIHIH